MFHSFRATREGNWALHLSTMRSMLTWYFGCDCVNYCHYGTAYWLEMTGLQETHPGNVWLMHPYYLFATSSVSGL